MRVKWLYYRDFKTRLTIGPGCWLEGGHGSGLSRKPTKSGSLSIVGQRMSRREEKPVSDAPSRPLSRKSRAESMGSLADYSQHGGYWGSNVVPANYQTQNLYRQQEWDSLLAFRITCCAGLSILWKLSWPSLAQTCCRRRISAARKISYVFLSSSLVYFSFICSSNTSL